MWWWWCLEDNMVGTAQSRFFNERRNIGLEDDVNQGRTQRERGGREKDCALSLAQTLRAMCASSLLLILSWNNICSYLYLWSRVLSFVRRCSVPVLANCGRRQRRVHHGDDNRRFHHDDKRRLHRRRPPTPHLSDVEGGGCATLSDLYAAQPEGEEAVFVIDADSEKLPVGTAPTGYWLVRKHQTITTCAYYVLLVVRGGFTGWARGQLGSVCKERRTSLKRRTREHGIRGKVAPQGAC